MINKLNQKAYKASYDKIKLTSQQKNDIIAEMLIERAKASEKNHIGNLINIFISKKVAVCALVVVVLLTGVIIISSVRSENSFVITSYAAELPESEQGGTVIGEFSNSAYSGFLMRDSDNKDEENSLYNGTCLNVQGKIDYFDIFELSELNIMGKNIESVTFKANKKFTYFSFSALGHKDKKPDEILDMFTDYDSIENSQYTKSQGTGFFATKGRCDSFTYKNPEISSNEQTINLSGYFSFVIESDRTDEEIDKCVDKIEKNYLAFEKVSDSEEISYSNNSEKSDEELNNEISQQVGIIDRKTLEGATIDVTVKFTDGSSQTQVIAVDYYQSAENGEYGASQIIFRHQS